MEDGTTNNGAAESTASTGATESASTGFETARSLGQLLAEEAGTGESTNASEYATASEAGSGEQEATATTETKPTTEQTQTETQANPNGEQGGESQPASETEKTGFDADVEKVKTRATELGFESPEEFIATVEIRKGELDKYAASLETSLRADIEAQKISPEYANELFNERMKSFEQSYDADITRQLNDRRSAKTSEEQLNRQIDQEFTTAKQTNPLLGAKDGIAKEIVTAYARAANVTPTEAIRILSDFSTGVAEQGVAAYVAKQSENKNTAPVVPAGGGQGGSSEQARVGLGQAIRNMFN